MTILGRFTKQPGETLDYPISFATWFSGRSDTYASHVVVAEAGITVVGSSFNSSTRILSVVLSGGGAGTKYKVTVRLTTNAGIVREVDFIVGVKET